MRRTGWLSTLRFGIEAAVLTAAVLACIGCGASDGVGSSAPAMPMTAGGPVAVSWAANRESAVNAPGGGYRVHYSNVSGFDVANTPFIDVPYVSGAVAPTGTSLDLAAGNYFIKVVAYSALNPSGSAPSAEIAVPIPVAAASVARAAHE